MIKATLISGLIAFVLMVVGLVVFAAYYDQPGQVEPVLINGSDMVLHRGRGYKTGHQLVMTAADSEKRIRIISPQLSFKAKDMPFMAWTFSHFSPRTGVWVGWVNSDNPQKLNMMPAILPYDSTAVYRMKDHPDWTGEIVALGFGFDRQMYEEFSLDSVEIRPYSMKSMLESIWDEWTAFEGWDLKSINLIKGGADHILIRPVPMVIVWVMISTISFYIFKLINKKVFRLNALLVFSILGWILLEVMWQVNLLRQNYLSYKSYAQKTLHEKRLLGRDQKLYLFAEKIKKHIPNINDRVFLTGKGMMGDIVYEQPRLQYFLMPYRVLYFENHYALYSPTLEEYDYRFNVGYFLRAGDYILVSGNDDRIYFNKENDIISFDGLYEYGVEQVYLSNSGALFKVLKTLKGRKL